MEIDGGEDIRNVWFGHIKLGQKFDLTARLARIVLQFSRDRDKILLQHLQRNNASSVTAMCVPQIARDTLFCRGVVIVRVDQDISVEETTSVHGSRPD